MELDSRDRDVLNAAQSGLPIASTPFAILGQTLDLSEKELIKRLDRLKREGAIRHICAAFDSRLLGYQTCLVAAKVGESDLERAAATISLHPGVTQNYQRNHEFNLWFTLALPSGSAIGIERTAAILGAEAGCLVVRTLPTLKTFSNLDGSDAASYADGAEPRTELAPEEVIAVRLLQNDLPVVPRPFDTLARGSGLTGDELLAATRSLKESRRLKRIAAIAAVRRPFSASAMGVWAVPGAREEEIGTRMAAHREVSQCFLRPTYSDWPYNLFTIVHGRTVDECESALAAISVETGITEMRALFPVREFKHSRAALFSPELESWERDRAAQADAASA